LLVLAVLAAYVPAIRGGFVWDDDFYVTDNATLRSLEGLRRTWLETDANPQYYPVTFTTFWVEYQLWGLNPLGYHLVNVLLHAGSSVLLWRLLRGLGVPGAGLAAALFALHPVHVESVAWITERKNTLSGLLYLAAARAFLGFASRDKPRRIPLGALVLFACALLSKSVTATLPIALGLVIVWNRGRLGRRELGWVGLMLVAGAGMGLLTAHLERHHVGAVGEDWALGPLERCLLAGRIFWFYLGKLAWPATLSFVYTRWPIDTADAGAYVFPLAAVGLVGALGAARRWIGPGALVALVYFVITVSPALGFVSVFPMRYAWTADHFQYLASIGPLALGAAAVTRLGERWKLASRAAWRLAAGVLLLALGLLTWRQAGTYRDEETLWRATLSRNPRAWMAEYNLARLLFRRGDLVESLELARRALQHKPQDDDTYNLLGNVLAAKGQVDDAIPMYRNAIRVNPRYAMAYHNLAIALEKKNLRQEAIATYRQALRVEPTLLPARNNLAVALYQAGAYPEAWREVEILERQGGRANREFVRLLRAKLTQAPGRE
jgi:tetratricopeptide (TPR) repeat protein